MYKIDSPNSLNVFLRRNPKLQNKVIAGRFKMQGCRYCVESQPLWDNMISETNQLYNMDPNTLFTEIDSQLTDSFIYKNSLK